MKKNLKFKIKFLRKKNYNSFKKTLQFLQKRYNVKKNYAKKKTK